MFRSTPNDGFQAFSPTLILDDDYLGRKRAGLRVLHCKCGVGRMYRLRRSIWMRIIPFLRLYRCARCGCKVLRLKLEHRARYPF